MIIKWKEYGSKWSYPEVHSENLLVGTMEKPWKLLRMVAVPAEIHNSTNLPGNILFVEFLEKRKYWNFLYAQWT
jgi:hypothetical protein